ncbi:GAF domain-containing protein [Leucobacter komagatae]|uniref:GAF domain-containing protein n=1 Tax=Leucobacter komagatae TaxID=55969 RepID=A0A542Y290_9MICO|nr:helix-turn-helix domain-containing protein [Leucobacter komagatae]TQL42190.1 GAF domain-containing protein [Leucobacter komagatae]
MIDADSSPLLAVLTALESNGPGELFERELDAASVARALTPGEAELLRRIDANLVRGRRRESLLRVLLETTTDLVAITDFDAMLQAIVRRTRMLLGSDMAYISLNDYDARETFVHTTDGVATEAYRNIRMELGSGVLGKIAAGTGSAQALDYIGDPDIIHVAEIDQTVELEGVRSIMGAPLLRDGVLLGALLVAERYQRRYTAEEVWLVESMSALACVALSNARLIGDMKAALAERDRFQGRLEVERSRLANEQEFERALVDCAVSDDPYGRLLTILREQRGGGIWLLDDIGRPLRGDGPLPLGEAAVEKALTRARLSGDVEVLADAAGERLSLLSVGAAARSLGGILVSGEATDDAERVLRRSGVMLSVMRLMDESSREESVKAQSELVHSLLLPEASFEPVALQRAARFGLAPGDEVHVHVVAADNSAALVADALRAHLGGTGVVAEYAGHAVVLRADNVGEQLVQALARKQIAATVGVERAAELVGSLSDAHRAAAATLSAMIALELVGQAATSAELGTVGMLMTSASPAQVRSIVAVELAPVLDYDAARGTELVETLWVFFGSDRHQARTAQLLHVHPNTLRQRLERVGALLGDDWQSARRSSMIFLALQLHRLRESVDER